MESNARQCRICTQSEGNEKFMPIFNSDDETASQIFSISKVVIIDYPEFPALICKKCNRNLLIATSFRNLCISSDNLFKSKTYNFEISKWRNELENLVDKTVKNEEVFVVKAEVESDEEQNDWNDHFNFTAELFSDDKKDVLQKPKKEAIQCPECDHVTFSKKSLRYHINTKHIKKALICKLCGMRLLSKNSLRRHIMKLHGIDKADIKDDGCHYCMEMFDNRILLNNHIKLVHEHDGRTYSCDTCGRSFDDKPNLKSHMRTIHRRKMLIKLKREKEENDPNEIKSGFPCPTCGKIFRDRRSLKPHENVHRVWRPEDYSYCDLCGNKFKFYSALKTHIKQRHIQNIRYFCHLCDRSFIQNKQLKRHIKLDHYNIKEHLCEWCGKEFGDKVKLVNHKRIHTGEKPFHCNQCGIRYTHETDYRRHMKAHIGIKRQYKCPHCQEISFNRNYMNKHKMTCLAKPNC